MTVWIALLRGINLGKRRLRMDDLKAAFVDMGFADARTLIASGNVVFSAGDDEDLAAKLEKGLERRFGFAVPTILRSRDDLVALCDAAPFGDETETDDQKLYVWFLGGPDIGKLAVPLEVIGNYRIVATTPREFFALVYRQPGGRFGDGLDKAGKPFEPFVTNRNWNTILRLIELAGG
ncbi:MAG: DUF1697 domain-containing protein [Alphaproteobacteria bacterium]|nr:DUF1697 domain-containing protein [Alphaproteobacteria bacterium]